jgi:hypothetical protein
MAVAFDFGISPGSIVSGVPSRAFKFERWPMVPGRNGRPCEALQQTRKVPSDSLSEQSEKMSMSIRRQLGKSLFVDV